MNKIFLYIIAGLSLTVLVILLIVNGKNLLSKNKNSQISQASPEDSIILPSSDLVLGQNFVVGILGTTLDEDTKIFLEHMKPAGIILYARNYQTRDQFKNLIIELQDFAKTTTGYQYFILIDEEPGGATRLGLFKNISKTSEQNWDQIENDIKEMRSIGINVDLAPLVDFPFHGDAFIKKRIPTKSPEAMADFNKKFIELLQKNNISATLKHFPGMGFFANDPHQALPDEKNDQNVIDQSLALFQSGIDDGANFVMTGHGVFHDLDPNVPSTLSKKITTEILRNNLNFKGLTITDDLSDMPFTNDKDMILAEATAESLKAGHNIVVFSHWPDKTEKTYNKLLQKIQNDPELKSRVEKNYRSIVVFKNKHL